MSRRVLTYNPKIFSVPDEAAARTIILTPEAGQSTDERWAAETPYLGELFGRTLAPGPDHLVVDYGCGVGRMSRELIRRFGCSVLGVDLSPEMRAMAPGYVQAAAFSVVSPEVFAHMVRCGLVADMAISVWVLQHCLTPFDDLDLLRRSLRPGGRLGVVNNRRRAVPAVEKTWGDDQIDIKSLLRANFATVEEGELDRTVVGRLADVTFRGTYERR